MDTLTYWNGTWHEGNPAILGPRDHAFWLGSIVFDGGRAFEGCGPDLDLHADRVVRSARSLGLKPTKTATEILELMHDAVRRFGPRAELYVRPMFWATKGGSGPISVDGDSTQFLLCVYHAPMRAGTPTTLGLCRTIRRRKRRRNDRRRRKECGGGKGRDRHTLQHDLPPFCAAPPGHHAHGRYYAG